MQHSVDQSDSNANHPIYAFLVPQLHTLQRWRAELWDACHGFPLQPLQPPQPGNQPAFIPLERITWAWSKTAKSLAALAHRLEGIASSAPAGAAAGEASSDAAAAAAAVLGGPQLPRLRHVAEQLSGSFGLDSQRSKPLLWRLGGHPQLPANARLAACLRDVAALCAALRVGPAGYEPDALGRPAGLSSAGIELGLDPEMEAPARDAYARAVAASLAADVPLRRALLQVRPTPVDSLKTCSFDEIPGTLVSPADCLSRC